jgi:hypothetical protein
MAENYNAVMKTEEFKQFLLGADCYAKVHNLDQWACRIVLVMTIYGPYMAERFAKRRAKWEESQAWDRWQRLAAYPDVRDAPGNKFYCDQNSDPEEWYREMVAVATPILPPEPSVRQGGHTSDA